MAGNGRSVGLGGGVLRRGQLQGVVGVSSSVDDVWFVVAEVMSGSAGCWEFSPTVGNIGDIKPSAVQASRLRNSLCWSRG